MSPDRKDIQGTSHETIPNRLVVAAFVLYGGVFVAVTTAAVLGGRKVDSPEVHSNPYPIPQYLLGSDRWRMNPQPTPQRFYIPSITRNP